MHSIISIVGKSGSGKTTLLEGLIAELKRRGHRIAMVKHSHHAFELDTPSKDTWRFIQAGSEVAAINSADNLAVFKRLDNYFDPQEIGNFILWDYDLIITEGFKSSPYPKIEIHRREQGRDLLTEPEQLLAVVTDEPLAVDAPQFSRDEIPGIADLIENTLSRRRGDDVNLIVNGNQVPINSSLQSLLARTLLAMLPAVREDGEIKSAHVSLRRQP
jgi:molybdopterin-guanine dinucleotide biosynthesis protein B